MFLDEIFFSLVKIDDLFEIIYIHRFMQMLQLDDL